MAPIITAFARSPDGGRGLARDMRVRWALEELGVPYDVIPVDIGKGAQFDPEFLKISPNNKMPALVDLDGPGGEPISVFESGAIMLYLGRKFGRFYPSEERARVEVEQWLMWQMGGFGPMLGQNHHFAHYAPEKIPYAIDRYRNETHRLYGVLDRRLKDRDYVAGDYSIADMAAWPWILPELQGQNLAEFPNLKAWMARVGARPGVIAGRALGDEMRRNLASSGKAAEAARKVLFGQRAR